MPKYAAYALKLVTYIPTANISLALTSMNSTGMYALRERRQHVTQEDFEFAIAKVLKKNQEGNMSVNKLFS